MSLNNVFDFNISDIIENLFYLHPEYNADLISIVNTYEEKRKKILKNIKYLETKMNLSTNFFWSCTNPDEMYETLCDRLIECVYPIPPPPADSNLKKR